MPRDVGARRKRGSRRRKRHRPASWQDRQRCTWWCMLLRVRRTNIYLSEVEQQALDARAAAEGVSRSDVVRSVIDRALNLDDDAEIDAVLADLAGELAAVARRFAATDPDLRAE